MQPHAQALVKEAKSRADEEGGQENPETRKESLIIEYPREHANREYVQSLRGGGPTARFRFIFSASPILSFLRNPSPSFPLLKESNNAFPSFSPSLPLSFSNVVSRG